MSASYGDAVVEMHPLWTRIRLEDGPSKVASSPAVKDTSCHEDETASDEDDAETDLVSLLSPVGKKVMATSTRAAKERGPVPRKRPGMDHRERTFVSACIKGDEKTVRSMLREVEPDPNPNPNPNCEINGTGGGGHRRQGDGRHGPNEWS